MAEWTDEWQTPQWRAQVDEWVGMVLEAYELNATGSAEQQSGGLFSTQLTIPTDHGQLFFKANCPGQVAEASVTATAANLMPDQLVMPLAIDPQRGWMITPDHGETLMAVPSTDHRIWIRMLQDFARVQQHLSGFGETLFDAGLLHLDPAWLPEYIDEQLVLHASLPLSHPLHLPERDAEELHRQLPEVKGMCEFLAAGPIPLSVDHNDLHRGNAFLPLSEDEPLRFMDLGDAYWAHPFSVLNTPIAVMCEELGTRPTDPRIREVIEAYLAEWEDYGSVDTLWDYVEPALRAGKMQQHAMAMRVLAGATEAELSHHVDLVLRPLAELAQPILTD